MLRDRLVKPCCGLVYDLFVQIPISGVPFSHLSKVYQDLGD